MKQKQLPPLQATLLDQAKVLKDGLDRLDPDTLSPVQKNALNDAREHIREAMYTMLEITNELGDDDYNELARNYGLEPLEELKLR